MNSTDNIFLSFFLSFLNKYCDTIIIMILYRDNCVATMWYCNRQPWLKYTNLTVGGKYRILQKQQSGLSLNFMSFEEKQRLPRLFTITSSHQKAQRIIYNRWLMRSDKKRPHMWAPRLPVGGLMSGYQIKVASVRPSLPPPAVRLREEAELRWCRNVPPWGTSDHWVHADTTGVFLRALCRARSASV